MPEQPAVKSTVPLSRLSESPSAFDTTAEVPVQSALWATSTNGRSTENSSEAQHLLPKVPIKAENSAIKPIGKSYVDACVFSQMTLVYRSEIQDLCFLQLSLYLYTFYVPH